VLILGNLFSGFVPNLELIFKASRNNSEMRDIRFELAIVLKAGGIFWNRTGCNKIRKVSLSDIRNKKWNK